MCRCNSPPCTGYNCCYPVTFPILCTHAYGSLYSAKSSKMSNLKFRRLKCFLKGKTELFVQIAMFEIQIQIMLWPRKPFSQSTATMSWHGSANRHTVETSTDEKHGRSAVFQVVQELLKNKILGGKVFSLVLLPRTLGVPSSKAFCTLVVT